MIRSKLQKNIRFKRSVPLLLSQPRKLCFRWKGSEQPMTR
ncbi:uncharacterized protein METZ01_LOCUS193972, partial [marine metagenome]